MDHCSWLVYGGILLNVGVAVYNWWRGRQFDQRFEAAWKAEMVRIHRLERGQEWERDDEQSLS